MLAACSKNIQNTEAVRLAVVEYLNARAAQTGLNMGAMEVVVTAVTFQRDEARASVSFRTKEGGSMDMNYEFDRKGDKWVVRPRSEGGSGPHGGAVPSADSPTGKLPEGHPPISEPKQ